MGNLKKQSFFTKIGGDKFEMAVEFPEEFSEGIDKAFRALEVFGEKAITIRFMKLGDTENTEADEFEDLYEEEDWSEEENWVEEDDDNSAESDEDTLQKEEQTVKFPEGWARWMRTHMRRDAYERYGSYYYYRENDCIKPEEVYAIGPTNFIALYCTHGYWESSKLAKLAQMLDECELIRENDAWWKILNDADEATEIGVELVWRTRLLQQVIGVSGIKKLRSLPEDFKETIDYVMCTLSETEANVLRLWLKEYMDRNQIAETLMMIPDVVDDCKRTAIFKLKQPQMFKLILLGRRGYEEFQRKEAERITKEKSQREKFAKRDLDIEED